MGNSGCCGGNRQQNQPQCCQPLPLAQPQPQYYLVPVVQPQPQRQQVYYVTVQSCGGGY